MGKLKVFQQNYPKWDYIHPSLIEQYPIIMYYFPNETIDTVYTVKIYWNSLKYEEGFGLIMDPTDLPHQGTCLTTFNIQQGKIDSESRQYLQQQHIQILQDVPLSNSIW
jgi:hypothetical protein